MQELSLHILDIIQNSIKAGADNIEVLVDEDKENNLLTIEIIDDGCGMSEEFLKKVRDPFVTTRTTRKTGLGISLFEAAAIQCGGGLDLTSELGKGTKFKIWFEYDNIDRAPLGDMAATMVTAVSGSPDIRFLYKHKINNSEFVFDTKEVKEILGEVPLNEPEIINWMDGFIREGTADINI